jgi:AcrR family transcriptional regulator
MVKTVTTNKQGQCLGEKGRATRARLMTAARTLLKKVSPLELTAVSIAQEAKTSSATFYMYFDDVKDIMFALSEAVGEDMKAVHEVLEEPWNPADIDLERAWRLIKTFDSIWQKHREILRYRNLEADRGDDRFERLRVQTYMPVIELMAKIIISAYPAGRRPQKHEAFAEAAVLYGSVEAIASTDPAVIERGLGMTSLQHARARVVAHVLGGRGPDDKWALSYAITRSMRRREAQAAAGEEGTATLSGKGA